MVYLSKYYFKIYTYFFEKIIFLHSCVKVFFFFFFFLTKNTFKTSINKEMLHFSCIVLTPLQSAVYSLAVAKPWAFVPTTLAPNGLASQTYVQKGQVQIGEAFLGLKKGHANRFGIFAIFETFEFLLFSNFQTSNFKTSYTL